MNKLHDIIDEIPPIKQPMRYIIISILLLYY